VTNAQSLGAHGARMTGAGAGGFVIACVPVQIIDKLQMAWREMGLKNIRTIQFTDCAKG
jgi:galactokinase